MTTYIARNIQRKLLTVFFFRVAWEKIFAMQAVELA